MEKKIQKEENEEKNRNLFRKKEIKEIYLKRFELEKNLTQEKNKEILTNYENELKSKMQKKVEIMLVNKSIDIRESLNEKKMSRNTTISQIRSKPLKIFEDSSEKVNPLNLIDNFNNSNMKEKNFNNSYLKEKKNPSLLESNEIQIRKIRNEISSLKNIINVINKEVLKY